MDPVEPLEFDCVECGRHIVHFVGDDREFKLCAACLFMPGWFRDPKLRSYIDRDMKVPPDELTEPPMPTTLPGQEPPQKPWVDEDGVPHYGQPPTQYRPSPAFWRGAAIGFLAVIAAAGVFMTVTALFTWLLKHI